MLHFRTNNLSASIETGSDRAECVRDLPGGGNTENIYNDDEDCYTISYSVPVKRGRVLPSIPKPESERKPARDQEERGSNNKDESDPVTIHKIYERLDSLTSPSAIPAAPLRPAWTLQVPDPGLSAASPLYLVMPEAEKRPSLVYMDLAETSASKTVTRNTAVRGTRASVSVSDTAKKVIKKLSVSLSYKLDDGEPLCVNESSETDSECDDVFS